MKTQEAITTEIEIFLLQAGGFVATREICDQFQISKRSLRQDEGRPGLLDDFAVSSTNAGESGYIHHRHLANDQWSRVEKRMRDHGVSELRRVRRWRKARHNILTGKRPDLREVHTGQAILPL